MPPLIALRHRLDFPISYFYYMCLFNRSPSLDRSARKLIIKVTLKSIKGFIFWKQRLLSQWVWLSQGFLEHFRNLIYLYDMIWYDMIWYDMIWYDMILYHIMTVVIYLLQPIYFFNERFSTWVTDDQLQVYRGQIKSSPHRFNMYISSTLKWEQQKEIGGDECPQGNQVSVKFGDGDISAFLICSDVTTLTHTALSLTVKNFQAHHLYFSTCQRLVTF